MMDEFYPNWWNELSTETETICIPACLDVSKTAYLGPTDPQASNYNEQLFNDNKLLYTGHNAEDAFMRAFQKLNLGGVLVSGFDTAEYAAKLEKNKRKSFKEFGIKDLEIDAIFVHPKTGICAIEIKATKNTDPDSNIFDSQYQKAISQLKNIKEQIPLIFKRMCNSGDFEIPIHLVVCFPFAFLSSRRHNVSIPQQEEAFIEIDESAFVDPERLKKYFVSRINFEAKEASKS